MSESDDRQHRVTFRLPRELHERLLGQASVEARTLNAEVVARLEASFAPGEMIEIQRTLIMTQQNGLLYLAGHLIEATQTLERLMTNPEDLRKWRLVKQLAEQEIRNFEDRMSRLISHSEDREPSDQVRMKLGQPAEADAPPPPKPPGSPDPAVTPKKPGPRILLRKDGKPFRSER
ncbi:Arc family DNA-binding protein [Roseomonas sp. BN140053]|uniref:Arc family DNA-binding protein n=1 Tax=Roseomonas sp. BN140053 TaxID=3391898 RepID=UPI0039ED657E